MLFMWALNQLSLLKKTQTSRTSKKLKKLYQRINKNIKELEFNS